MEFVYVVPRRDLFPDCYPQGLTTFGKGERCPTREDFGAAVREHGFFAEREVAERTPTWKQIITYSVVRVGEEVLLMRRLANGGESRLHDKLSIGVGGHINPEDLTPEATPERDVIPASPPSRRRNPILAGTLREIEEEIDVQGSYEIHQVGLLNDDSNPVGAVHLGLVQVVHVTGSVKIREKDVLEGRLAPAEELRELLDSGANLETWSSILIENLEKLFLSRDPARI